MIAALIICVVAFIYAAVVIGVILFLRDTFPTLKAGCSGDCNQGRRPCNCHLKDIGIDK